MNSSNKKRRLESELSQTSGNSVFSSITQSTVMSNDSEDRKSDTSLDDQNTGIRGSNSNVLDGIRTQVNDFTHDQSHKRQRKPKISWSLCDYEDETFLKDVSPAARTTRPPPAPYDNNINGTHNNRQRTRRATDSCLETHGGSNSDHQSHREMCSVTNSQTVHPLRSNTTSELYTHEHEIQKQRLVTQMTQEFDDVQRWQRVQQRRSQSANSLQDHTCYTTTSRRCNQCHYDSIQQLSRPTTPNRRVETIVNIADSDPNHLHPIIQVERPHANNTGTLGHQIVHNCSEMSDGSGYIHVNGSNDKSNCFRNCNNSFYRKGFFVLLVLNVIFVLLNVVGLPFLYYAIQSPDVENAPKVGAQRSDTCIPCEGLDLMARTKLAEFGVYKSKDGLCCVGSVGKLLPAIMEVTEILAWSYVQENLYRAKTAVVQLNASKGNTLATSNKIIWDTRPVIHNFDVQIIDNYMLKVPITGYYYVFSRVGYQKKVSNSSTTQFMVGHSLIKQDFNDRSSMSPIDKTVMRCDFSTGDVRYTNQLSSIQHLQKGDILFIQLDDKTFFDPTSTTFGLFLIAT